MSPEVEPLGHDVVGDGEPLLLLNGGMMTYASWQPVSGRLSARYRVLLCDFRGQFLSPGQTHRTLSGHVSDVVDLLDRLALDAVHVIGTSFGGEVGLLLAASHPARVRTLVAVTVGDHATEAMRREVADLRQLLEEILAGGDPGRLHDRLVDGVYSAEFVAGHREELAARRGQVTALPAAWFRGLEGLLAATEDFDLRPHLGQIRCPTLVVVAGRDRAMPVERCRALAAAIPGAEVVEHPRSGHALVVEDPGWLADVCLEFLDRDR